MKLSPQENSVLTLVACGYTDVEAAKKLKISHRTVEKYMASVILKLRAKNRVSAVAIYMMKNPNWQLKIRKILL